MIDHRLMTLRAFASCGTVAATAELTGYSPSAVSAQLRELQHLLGMKLLVKEGRGLQLTSTGRYLVRKSETLVVEWDRIKAAALTEGGQEPTNFGIGGFSTAASNLLAPLAADLRRTKPSVHVHVIEASPGRCFDLLMAERIDLAVVVAMQADIRAGGDPRFEQTPLLNDPLDVMVPSEHPLAERESVRLEELSHEFWISDAPGTPYHALFTAAFTAVGATPRIEHEVIEWETAIALVAAGAGIGLIPRLASLGGAENVVRLPLSGVVKPSRRIVAAVRTGTADAPMVKSALDYLQATARRLLTERLAESP
ncbi:LysR family transcriptional regulator [Zhihengliuella salsuginis]|uniref:LysR family transcriptional regulator n=1 Tax=Zhihengliuella salsuginis TaxID=578222 RepID=A0ABQ3GP46_9MICC|nr:LysR family transcriptional regulator [Zhihengliuella salsuginis]GHD13542.1 LysR family transcriptional regulator [Zhihengliuella salsuginis]